MTASRLKEVSLRFGASGALALEIDPDRVMAWRGEVEAVASPLEAAAAALESPLEFPPLHQAVIPDDRVTLALDPEAPAGLEMVAAVWNVLAERGVVAENVVVLQPGVREEPRDPRSALPPAVARRVQWKVHDPDNPKGCAYLASTASGERIYLASSLVEAEVVVALGEIAFDPLLGCRGTNSVFYPGLSTRDAIRKAHGQGHAELGPDDDRPLRQLVDEVGWLLGAQFCLQAIPAANGGAATLLAGGMEAVMKKGRRLLARHWLVELDARPDVVVAAVDARGAGDGWDRMASAAAAARGLVARGGKIVLLTDLAGDPGEGVQSMRGLESPRDALRPLRTQSPPDLIAATQLASAADWARIYLLSGLDATLVDELFMSPVETTDEVERLLDTDETCVFLSSAQHVHARVKR